jgi:hypothetical protein
MRPTGNNGEPQYPDVLGLDPTGGVLDRMPIPAAHAGQLAGVTIPYSWILR